MERNIVVIDLEKYDELIKENQQMKLDKASLKEKLDLKEQENEAVNNNIANKIYKDSKWELGQIINNKEDNYNYYSREIRSKFENYGYTSQDYIKENIDYMITRYEEENKKEEE